MVDNSKYSCYHSIKILSYQIFLIGGVVIKQIIVRLDDNVHQDLKLKTIKDGVSVQGFIKEFVEIYLQSESSASQLLEKIKK